MRFRQIIIKNADICTWLDSAWVEIAPGDRSNLRTAWASGISSHR